MSKRFALDVFRVETKLGSRNPAPPSNDTRGVTAMAEFHTEIVDEGTLWFSNRASRRLAARGARRHGALTRNRELS